MENRGGKEETMVDGVIVQHLGRSRAFSYVQLRPQLVVKGHKCLSAGDIRISQTNPGVCKPRRPLITPKKLFVCICIPFPRRS